MSAFYYIGEEGNSGCFYSDDKDETTRNMKRICDVFFREHPDSLVYGICLVNFSEREHTLYEFEREIIITCTEY